MKWIKTSKKKEMPIDTQILVFIKDNMYLGRILTYGTKQTIFKLFYVDICFGHTYCRFCIFQPNFVQCANCEHEDREIKKKQITFELSEIEYWINIKTP